MTIQTISDQIKNIQTKWRTVVTSRPAEESAVKNFFGPGASYAVISLQLDRWLEQVGRIALKPRVSRTLPKNLLMLVGRNLSSASRSLDSVGNGVEWIFLSGGFGQSLLMADYLISELVKDSAREQTQILDAAQERLTSDLSSLQAGSEMAKKFETDWPEVQGQVELLSASTETVSTTLDELQTLVVKVKADIQTQAEDIAEKIELDQSYVVAARSEFDVALVSARADLKEAEVLKKSAVSLLAETSKRSESAEKNLVTASDALKKATSQQIATGERLTLALRDAQMEGLAGSFTRMAENTEIAMKNEQSRFDRALFYLMFVGIFALIFELSYGFSQTAEEFAFRLVRMLSLATPGIWIAWLASRKLSALNRVFTDYQYKSASALAYESYRQTVADAGNDELKQRLLAFAIQSFGENPTRYFDNSKGEAASPLDAIFDRFPLLSKLANATDSSNTKK